MIKNRTPEEWAKYLLQQRWTKALLMTDDPFHLYVDVLAKAMDQAFESGRLHERHQTKVLPAIEKVQQQARIETIKEVLAIALEIEQQTKDSFGITPLFSARLQALLEQE